MVNQLIHGGSTLAEFKISLLDALQMVRAARDSATAETVINCFHRGGFSLPSEVMGSLEEDMDPDLQEQEEEEQVSLDFLNLEEGCTCTFKEYVHCDSSLQCAPMLTSQDIATQNPAEDDTDDVW